jgi:hypothetical protein
MTEESKEVQATLLADIIIKACEAVALVPRADDGDLAFLVAKKVMETLKVDADAVFDTLTAMTDLVWREDEPVPTIKN